ncbi:MAG: lipoyl domain-containing protein [Candidatus Omnitrophota bacterium]
MANVLLPPLGEGIEKATVTFWFFKPGDTVQKDENLVELTTDKAAFNLPCPASGVLKQIICEEGREVRVGEILAVIE